LNTKKEQLCQCPICAYAGKRAHFDPRWIEMLVELIARHSGLGFEGDLGDMEISELYGLYRSLSKDD